MANKNHFLIVDTETTQNQHVADFGAVLTDRKGRIIKTCAVLVNEFYTKEELWYDENSSMEIWNKLGLAKRKNKYVKMLESGSRMIGSVAAINRWLERINGEFSPELTAYNLAFDLDKCFKSNIDLSIFEKRFCLWHLSSYKYARSKKYLEFILAHHYFNAPTELGNMSYKTNAEIMARFCTGKMLEDEPHTALEDVLYYELPILIKIVNTKNWREKIKKYSWPDFQVKDCFTAKTNTFISTGDTFKR